MCSIIAILNPSPELSEGMIWLMVGIGLIYHYVGKMEDPYDDE